MKIPMSGTLAATLIATSVGAVVLISGYAKTSWPAHPQIAAFSMTVLVSIVVKQVWPIDADHGRD